jgi:hypothetical protein
LADDLLGAEERGRIVGPDWQRERHDIGPNQDTLRAQQSADYAAWFTLETNVVDAVRIAAHNAAGVFGILGIATGRSGVDHAAERKAQADLIREIFGNPVRPPLMEAVWRTRNVLALAVAADRERIMPDGTLERDNLAILGDALEDAGCTDADILAHCRGPGPHAVGCWVVDLIAG